MNETNRTGSSRSLKARLRSTFGSLAVPTAGPRSLLAFATVPLLIVGAAKADWQVYDNDVHEQLRDQITPRLGAVSADGVGTGSVTGNQRLSYEMYRIGASSKTGDAVEHPQWPAATSVTDANGTTTTTSGFKLDKFSDMTAGAATGAGAITLNSNIGRCGGSKAQQKAICEEIVKTENAKFIYAVRFHEMAAKRLEVLEALGQERESLDDSPRNYGKLQDNTNKLLALNTRMVLDAAQLESAAQAYEARLSFLRALQAQKTREQMTGKAAGSGAGLFDIDLRSLGGAVVGGAALKAALESQRSSPPDGYRKMEWLD